MSTRDELTEYLLTIDNDPTWVGDLLDAFATEAVHAAAEKMRTAWLADYFPVHENDGVHGATEYLMGMTIAYGEPHYSETPAP